MRDHHRPCVDKGLRRSRFRLCSPLALSSVLSLHLPARSTVRRGRRRQSRPPAAAATRGDPSTSRAPGWTTSRPGSAAAQAPPGSSTLRPEGPRRIHVATRGTPPDPRWDVTAGRAVPLCSELAAEYHDGDRHLPPCGSDAPPERAARWNRHAATGCAEPAVCPSAPRSATSEVPARSSSSPVRLLIAMRSRSPAAVYFVSHRRSLCARGLQNAHRCR